MAWLPSLKPSTGLEKPKVPDFAVSDIEAADWIKFLVIGYYAKHEGREIWHHFNDMGEYIDWIFSSEQPYESIYFHFGGKYDFMFALKELFSRRKEYYIDNIIPRGSMLLCFSGYSLKRVPKGHFFDEDKFVREEADGTVVIKGRKIEFRDSSAMLPFSLASLTENFRVEHKKQSIDYESIKEVTPELLEYLMYDCKGLYEVIEKYISWPLIQKAGPAYTMAGQAMKVFRLFMTQEITSLSAEVDEFVRGAYFGGRTEIFKPLYLGNTKNPIFCLDVNSLYPTMMLEEMPTNVKFMTDKYMPEMMGFYDAEVYVPESMYIPPLGVLHKVGKTTKYIFPTGYVRGRFSTIELEYAKSIGCKIIRTGRGVLFKNGGKIFKDYILELYKIRENSSKDTVDNVLAKLLMNSLYGRFGIRRDRENVAIDYGQEGVEPVAEIECAGGDIIRLVKEPAYLDKSFSNVAISAWVTSLARIHMHKIYMKIPEAMYYTDTDSLFTQKLLETDDSRLGELKKEYAVSSACFLLPKTYLVNLAEPLKDKKTGGEIWKKTVMKGFDREKIKEFTLEDFQHALEGELHLLKVRNKAKFATFRSAVSRGDLLSMMPENDREIRSCYDKRRIVKLASGAYDTEPLCIRNDEVVNR